MVYTFIHWLGEKIIILIIMFGLKVGNGVWHKMGWDISKWFCEFSPYIITLCATCILKKQSAPMWTL